MYRRISLFALLCACLLTISGMAFAAGTITVNAASINHVSDALKISAPRTYEVVEAENTDRSLADPATVCGRNVDQPVWFKFKADRAVTIVLSTEGSHLAYSNPYQSYSEDTVMALYAHLDPNSAPSHLTLAEVACNDDAVMTIEESSQIGFTAEPGMQYYVMVMPHLSAPDLLDGSSYRLNVRVINLMESGNFEDMGGQIAPWKSSALGSGDDGLSCAGADCNYRFQHGLLGASKLKQVIKRFAGLKLSPGVSLRLGVTMTFNDQPNASMKLKVIYADGTSEQVTTALTSANDSGTLVVNSTFLLLDKAVEKIIVQFIDSTGGYGWLDIDNVSLIAIVLPPVRDTLTAPVLPLPAAPLN